MLKKKRKRGLLHDTTFKARFDSRQVDYPPFTMDNATKILCVFENIYKGYIHSLFNPVVARVYAMVLKTIFIIFLNIFNFAILHNG